MTQRGSMDFRVEPIPLSPTQSSFEIVMDADRNLLFGVLALQVDLLDSDRFVQAVNCGPHENKRRCQIS